MIRFITALIILIPYSASAGEYGWFEGLWVSDAESTISINPEHREADEETQELLRNVYGILRWNIRDGNLTVFYPTASQPIESVTPFFIRRIDSKSFEMVFEDYMFETKSDKPFDFRSLKNTEIENSLGQYVRTVWKSEAGFCTVPSPDFIIRPDGSRANLTIECFGRLDTE